MATEKRLIDARAGKKLFCAIAKPAEYNGAIHLVVPISEIDKLPTVDAVEVVRCKDCSKKIWCEDGRTFRFPSERDAARLMGVQSQNIVACLKGRLKTAGGYRWKYADDCCSYGERKDNG